MKTLFETPNAHEPNQAWCVYSHFDADGGVQDYVIEALKCIKASGLKIVVMSTSPSISEAGLKAMSRYATTIILRDNIGYDFGSYKLGIAYLKEIKAKPCKLLITNDSVYGPMKSLKPILKMSNSFDMFGMTDSIEINYHLQSYFIIYNKQILESKAFAKFWDSVKLFSNDQKAFKQIIINEYEVGGSQLFMRLGYKLGAAFSFKKISRLAWREFSKEIDKAQTIQGHPFTPLVIGYNITHFYWDQILTAGCPYIKKELLTLNPMNKNIHNWPAIVKENFNYDPNLILLSLLKSCDNTDFLYVHNDIEFIARELKLNGKIKLPINPHYANLNLPKGTLKTENFIFDEDFYLKNSPDVQLAIKKHIVKGGIEHFKERGFKENKFINLVKDKRSDGDFSVKRSKVAIES